MAFATVFATAFAFAFTFATGLAAVRGFAPALAGPRLAWDRPCADACAFAPVLAAVLPAALAATLAAGLASLPAARLVAGLVVCLAARVAVCLAAGFLPTAGLPAFAVVFGAVAREATLPALRAVRALLAVLTAILLFGMRRMNLQSPTQSAHRVPSSVDHQQNPSIPPETKWF